MKEKLRLKPEALRDTCHIEDLSFDTTEELKPLEGIIGQDRAEKALEFGLKIQKKGFNIFITGLSGTGRNSFANSITEKFAKDMPIPKDWLYVFNFKNPDGPKALSMKAGTGLAFKRKIENMIGQLKNQIPTAFSGAEYEKRRNDIVKKFQEKSQDLLKKLNTIAKDFGFLFKESEEGIITIPLKDERPMTQEEYAALSHDKLEDLREASKQLSIESLEFFNELRDIEGEMATAIKKLDEKTAHDIINYYIKKLLEDYKNNEDLLNYIRDLEKDIIENIDFFKAVEKTPDMREFLMMPMRPKNPLDRYRVNLFINNSQLKYAPIINETNPTYNNILGTVEYRNVMGALKTDFMEIKPGSLHRANGGFLIVQAKDILTQAHSWETLKRTLKTGKIKIESLSSQMGHVITSTLKPEPIPINVKVIIIGDAASYHMLYRLDEDFKKLFKVMADFDVEMEKNQENLYKMARFIATHCDDVGLLDFDKSAIARVIEYSSRLASHQEKLSARFNQIVEILYEADTWAQGEGAKIVNERHVETAIEQKIYRNNKYEEKLNEMFDRGDLLIDVEGKKVGQINGLAVMGTGEYSFGRPNRITVSTYRGKAGIINIEREVKKSGSIHDKGVLILEGYLGCKYAQEKPLSLSVSISFEQSYSIIDGDSASSTELYAILSSIAQVPIDQGIAVTGSINQKGEIQPIGGVNEKIEGFYDLCKLKGLTGQQGVIIPRQNIKNLVLRKDIVEAVDKGHFHIYAVSHVEEGVEILTGMAAGEIKEDGTYPRDTINYLITSRLESLSEKEEKTKAYNA